MLHILDCKPTDEIFSHDDHGVIRNFNATRMQEWADSNSDSLEKLITTLDASWVDFILKYRGIEQPRVDRLKPPYLFRPVLGVVMPDFSTLMVDGHHRLVKLYNRGFREFKMIRFPLGKWESFLVRMDF